MEIAKNGVDEFYSGETAKKLVKDIQDAGGIITLDDLNFALLILFKTQSSSHYYSRCNASSFSC